MKPWSINPIHELLGTLRIDSINKASRRTNNGGIILSHNTVENETRFFISARFVSQSLKLFSGRVWYLVRNNFYVSQILFANYIIKINVL